LEEQDRAKLLRLRDYGGIRGLRRQVILHPQHLVAGGGQRFDNKIGDAMIGEEAQRHQAGWRPDGSG